MSVAAAEAIANAVLYEGYVLYPYRASAPKNQIRWQVGLVTPRSFAETVRSDPWFTQTECLCEPRIGARLEVRVRALQIQQRCIDATGDGGCQWRPVAATDVDERCFVEWDEAVVAEFTRGGIVVDGTPAAWRQPWVLDSHCDEELISARDGRVAARVRRQRREIRAAIQVALEPCGRLMKVRVRVENETPSPARTLADRSDAVRLSLAGTHVILSLDHGAFMSLLEPPAEAVAAASACVNQHTFPVLVGTPPDADVMLSSPIILYDYPAIAPESRGDFFDATEIDELLTLRVQTLTDAEKREARATDERAAGVLDRCEAMSDAAMRQLHGAIRQRTDGGAPLFRSGLRVRIEPARTLDSIDLCLRGRLATVTAVHHTIEGVPYIAVVPDDDPFADAGERFRRSLFFHPDELVPVPGGNP